MKLATPGQIQRSLFDQWDRVRVRQELLQTTEKLLAGIASRVAAGRLKQRAKICIYIGQKLNQCKMGKHFDITNEDGGFTYRRKEEAIQKEAGLDGIYMLHTNVPAEKWSAADVVAGYKSLSHVESAFRNMKSIDLKVRPIHHRPADRVCAHVFLCMLAHKTLLSDRWSLSASSKGLAPYQRY